VRICSLLPSATEIAFALGLGDSVVGVTHECDYPPEAKQREVVVKSAIDPHQIDSSTIDKIVTGHLKAKKSLYTIDLARFKETNPDLILTQGLCDVCALDYQEVSEAAKTLARRPNIISLTPETLTDVLTDIAHVGQATGTPREAAALVDQLSARIQHVREQASRSDLRPRVACVEWLDPIYCAGHWVPEMVGLAGGIDGLGKMGQPSQKIDWSQMIDYGPEIMVLMPCGFNVERTIGEIDLLYRLPGWKDLPAVKEGNVFTVNGHAYFNRSGPRLVEGLEILAQIVHPESFPWTAAPDAARKLS
jgi:iron complex transport system substrate-binding protein